MIALTKYTFTKDKVFAAPKSEQHLFLLAGHLLNEFNVLVRLVAWSSNYKTEEQAVQAGGLVTQLTSILYFLSKLHEGWVLLKERFTPDIQEKYLLKFNDEGKQSYRALETYFATNGRSLIEKVRNNFGFHNNDQFKLVLQAFHKHPSQEFDIYMNNAPGMCIFDISEQTIGFCLGRIVNDKVEDIESYGVAFNQLLDESSEMNGHIQNVLLAFQVAFIEKYIKNSSTTQITVEPTQKFNDMTIPYFTKTDVEQYKN